MFLDRLDDVLTIMTIQPHDDNIKTTTHTVSKQETLKTKLASSFTVESSYEKLKMIQEETCLKLNRKKNKTTIPYSWEYQQVSNTELVSINNKQTSSQYPVTRNKSLQQFFMGLQAKSCSDIKLPPLEGTKIHKLNPHNRLPIPGYDVRQNTWDIRNLQYEKNQSIDHKVLRDEYLNRESTCVLPFKSKTQVKPQLSNNLIRSLKEPTLISQLYNSMSSLRLDNRHDMAANDHVRHHIKRQQQWIRSDQVKNWRKSPLNRIKKQAYSNSASSAQKSDVISGNSDESLNTTSSTSETQKIIDFEYDEERREAIEKCMQWMNDLPTKFSGLHILDPAKS